jgi:hypothetical protein
MGRFLGIMGFIGTGLVLLCALFIGTIFSVMAKLQPTLLPVAGLGGFFSFIYILIALFYFFFSLYLYQFGNNAKAGVTFSNEMQVTVALGKLKSFFKMWGITTIVIISLYILMIIGFIIAIPMMKHGITGTNTITSLR